MFDIDVMSSHIAVTIRPHKENKLFSLPILEDFLHQPISPPRPYETSVTSPQKCSVRDTSALVLLTNPENPNTFFFLAKRVGRVIKEHKWKTPPSLQLLLARKGA